MVVKTCDVSYMTGYGKECKESPEDCIWWERMCKKEGKNLIKKM